MPTKSKKSVKKTSSDNLSDIHGNFIKKTIDFDRDIRSMLEKWIDSLSREAINAHIEWICSEQGTDFLEKYESVISSKVFIYMLDAKIRYEEDRFNDPGSELCDSLRYLLEEEVHIDK